MALSFPTRPRGAGGIPSAPGQPTRAHHCVCRPDQQILDEHGEACARCGHYTLETITGTWAARAKQLSAARAKRPKRVATHR
jgi:hypothetical protein